MKTQEERNLAESLIFEKLKQVYIGLKELGYDNKSLCAFINEHDDGTVIIQFWDGYWDGGSDIECPINWWTCDAFNEGERNE